MADGTEPAPFLLMIHHHLCPYCQSTIITHVATSTEHGQCPVVGSQSWRALCGKALHVCSLTRGKSLLSDWVSLDLHQLRLLVQNQGEPGKGKGRGNAVCCHTSFTIAKTPIQGKFFHGNAEATAWLTLHPNWCKPKPTGCSAHCL